MSTAATVPCRDREAGDGDRTGDKPRGAHLSPAPVGIAGLVCARQGGAMHGGQPAGAVAAAFGAMRLLRRVS
ncbi:MAG TPA: hypothetical protein VGF07_08420 [Stellaceae bacterium]